MSRRALVGTIVVASFLGSCSREPTSHSAPDDPPAAEPERAQTSPPFDQASPPFDPAAHSADLPRLQPAQVDQILARENVVDVEPALHIGSRAPAIRVDGWLKGDPVTLSRGTIYVVENWATWCKPCRDAMPHLSELAERYAKQGLVVLAINVEETELEEVRQFLVTHDADMRYSVGYDRSSSVQKEWLQPAGLRGLPASFVVDRQGKIAWIGHPSRLAKVVEDIVGGRWDLEAQRASATRKRLAVPFSRRVVELLETEPRRGYELAWALLAGTLNDQPEVLDALAYHVFAAPTVATRNLELAYAAGALASAQHGWSDPASLETLSKIREAQNRLSEAIVLQRQAVLVSGEASRFVLRLHDLTHNP